MTQSSLQVPVLETPRLLLRPHRQSDFDSSFAMWSDPVVVQYIAGKPSTEQASWGRLLNYLGLWALLGYGYWAVEEKATGAMIGELGFADFRRDLQPSIRGTPELGWALASHVHRRGYATEGLRAALAWADASLPAPKTVCLISPENLPSLKLAAKLGYLEQARTSYGGKDVILFSRRRSHTSI